MRGWSRFLVIVVAVGWQPLVHARDVPVADQRAFAAAAAAVRPGDTIILADGEWRDVALVLSGEGTAERPITIAAQTPGKVIVTGRSSLRIGGSHLVVRGLVFRDGHSAGKELIAFRTSSRNVARHSRLTEVVIDGYSNPDRRAEDIWVAIYGSDNRVDHSHFEGKTNAGVTLAVIRPRGVPDANRHLIDHNYFGPRPPLGSNGGETIRVGTSEESLSDSNTVIERNMFDRASGEVEIVSIKSGGNVVRENVVLASQGAFVLRHGNGNLVERNVFLGRGVADTGGVRVINRDQVVRGNYMEGLAGTAFRSAISVMNGVPNSVINRYHQVSGARIENNSVIDSARITLAAGADEERSAPPIDSLFARNLVTGTEGKDPFRAEGEIGGITLEGNVQAAVAKPLLGQGVEQRDVVLERAANGLLYPVDPALAALGAPRDLDPVTRDEVGVSWYRSAAPEAAFGSGAVIPVAAGASLAEAVGRSDAGDVVELAAGRHALDAPLSVRHRLSIVGAEGERPVVDLAGGGFARLEGGGGLRLSGLVLDATRATADAALIAVEPGIAPNYELHLEGVAVTGPGTAARIDGIVMAPGTFAQGITLRGSSFAGLSGAVVQGTGEQEAKGWYPVENLTIEGSSFHQVGMVADLLRKGTDESTFGPWVRVASNSVAESGRDGASLRLSGAQHAVIAGNSFVRSAPVQVIHSVSFPDTRIAGNTFRATPAPEVIELHYRGPQRAAIEGNTVGEGI
jgi:poly(beta-D-mannuronate) lyase